MPDLHLHIISFDIPLPANYGGVIDVYYKAKALSEQGVKVHLHCFEYGRPHVEALERDFFKVYYYKRDVSKAHLFDSLPYIVSTRTSETLVNNLLCDHYPILMEGLHTALLLDDERLKNRKRMVRAHNIEHDYYLNLSRVEKAPFKKYFYYNESLKLVKFEKILSKADYLFAISTHDYQYFSEKFENVVFVPAFHPHKLVACLPGKGDYVLYHGKLSVPENANAVRYLIIKVFDDLNLPFIIAGLNPPAQLVNLVNRSSNVSLIANPDDSTMSGLIRNAHINISVAFQVTGLKLKLLNSLYNGRFCLVNDKMLSGSKLDSLCVVANDAKSMRRHILRLLSENFTNEMKIDREKVLGNLYKNGDNVKRLIGLIA